MDQGDDVFFSCRKNLFYNRFFSIKRSLPIGSGKIENTNRALVQARIKLPGAWWLSENVENIVLLRVLRENGLWSALWPLMREWLKGLPREYKF